MQRPVYPGTDNMLLLGFDWTFAYCYLPASWKKTQNQVTVTHIFC